MALGLANRASIAGPPSPLNPGSRSPLLATGVVMPVWASIRHTRVQSISEKNTFPKVSTAIPHGAPGAVSDPWTLSAIVTPAMVVMIPVSESTRRTLKLFPSAMKMFPVASVTTPAGNQKPASMADLPSPPKAITPFPATVSMMPVLRSTLRIRWLLRSAINRLPDGSTNTSLGNLSSASVAGPPSPWKPDLPVPATVVMMWMGVGVVVGVGVGVAVAVGLGVSVGIAVLVGVAVGGGVGIGVGVGAGTGVKVGTGVGVGVGDPLPPHAPVKRAVERTNRAVAGTSLLMVNAMYGLITDFVKIVSDANSGPVACTAVADPLVRYYNRPHRHILVCFLYLQRIAQCHEMEIGND